MFGLPHMPPSKLPAKGARSRKRRQRPVIELLELLTIEDPTDPGYEVERAWWHHANVEQRARLVILRNYCFFDEAVDVLKALLSQHEDPLMKLDQLFTWLMLSGAKNAFDRRRENIRLRSSGVFKGPIGSYTFVRKADHEYRYGDSYCARIAGGQTHEEALAEGSYYEEPNL